MSTTRNARKNASLVNEILARYSLHPEFLGINLTDINQVGSSGDAILHIAVRRDATNIISTVLQCGADINMHGDIENTPLHFAAMAGRTEVVQLLIDKGANRKLLNIFGETPLQVAQNGGFDDIVKILR